MKFFSRIWNAVMNVVSDTSWTKLRKRLTGNAYGLTPEVHERLKVELAAGYYIILTSRKSHLTTWLIGILNWLKVGKWPRYAHALMNVDNVSDPAKFTEFRLIEATIDGVHWSQFEHVFDCDSVCLLRAKNMSPFHWNTVMERLMEQEGVAYDQVFNLTDDAQVSCVEMCLVALRAEPNYAQDFANLEAMIAKVGNLTPQMYRDCPDFEVAYEYTT